MKTALLFLLFTHLGQAQSPNVVFCNGNDQAALQGAINTQAAAITESGGGGPVFVAAASVPCQFTTLTLPAMNRGSLVVLIDNPMIGGTIKAGTNTALRCNSGTSFLGLSGAFLYGPTCSIRQTRGLSQPLLDLAGVSQFYAEGINFETTNVNTPAVVHIHDKAGAGSVYLHFRRCTFGTYAPGLSIVADSSGPSVVSGFGLKIEDSSIQAPVSLTNFGQITITHSFMPSVTMTNAGIASDGDLEVDDVLSEALNNADFLTINQTGGQVADITLRRVKLADTSGNSYLIRENSSYNSWTPVLVEQTPVGNVGSGLIDPASAANQLDVYCIGSVCPAGASGLAGIWRTLYSYTGLTGRNGLTIFGSQYLTSPLQICGPPNKAGNTPICAAASSSGGLSRSK